MRRLFLLALLLPGSAWAQTPDSTAARPDTTLAPPDSTAELVEPDTLAPPPRESFDARLFRRVYNADNPVFNTTMRRVNDVSFPLFVAAAPLMAAQDVAGGDGLGRAALRMLVSEAGVAGVIFATKFVVKRPRPYAALPEVHNRSGDDDPGGLDPYSFPSGHAAAAFAIATSASLSYPKWYVVAPTMTWASATALARVWHGVHYPTDIAVGALVGAGVGALTHALLPDGEPEDAGAAPEQSVRAPLFLVRWSL